MFILCGVIDVLFHKVGPPITNTLFHNCTLYPDKQNANEADSTDFKKMKIQEKFVNYLSKHQLKQTFAAFEWHMFDCHKRHLIHEAKYELC